MMTGNALKRNFVGQAARAVEWLQSSQPPRNFLLRAHFRYYGNEFFYLEDKDGPSTKCGLTSLSFPVQSTDNITVWLKQQQHNNFQNISLVN